jgi:hypothetical protein
MPIIAEHVREFKRRKVKFWAIGGTCLLASIIGWIGVSAIGRVDASSSASAWGAMLVSISVALGGAMGFLLTGHLVLRCPNCERPPTHPKNVMHKAAWCIHCKTRLL